VPFIARTTGPGAKDAMSSMIRLLRTINSSKDSGIEAPFEYERAR
jgi:hypothetical protein